MDKTLGQYFSEALSYTEFITHFEQVLHDPPADYPYHEYVKLNWSRHKRLTKNTELDHNFAQFNDLALKCLVITEAWCGDSAQNLPVIHHICKSAGFEIKIVRRDKTEIILDYLTNGGQSIPKVIFFAGNNDEQAVWGPRPQPVQKMVIDNKQNGHLSYDELSIETQKWYNQDGSKTLQNEIYNLLSKL